MNKGFPPFSSDKQLAAQQELDRVWEIIVRVSQVARLEDILDLVDKADKLASDLIDLDIAQQEAADAKHP